MGRNQYSYPPEYRARMVELVRAGEATCALLASSSHPTRRPLPWLMKRKTYS